MTANVDDFVTGPAALGAIGLASLELICPDCAPNDPFEIVPTFGGLVGTIAGQLEIHMQIPGIGGSLSPPQGSDQTVRGFVNGIGGRCNQALPANSSAGRVALVALMLAAALFFARPLRRV